VFVVLCGVQMDLESAKKDEMKKNEENKFLEDKKNGGKNSCRLTLKEGPELYLETRK